jgi:p-cumate 2,3-dioxygenase subunit beta
MTDTAQLDGPDVTGTTEFTRAALEDFLFHEAALLDEWRLEEWLDLFTDDCVYEIPAPDLPESDASRTFSLIHDRRTLLEQRVIRLKKPTAHAEFPHSRTRRLITNVRVLGHTLDEVMVGANFAVYRLRNGRDVCYVGRYEYVLKVTRGGLKIKHRKVLLDQTVLDPHGKISIIL